MIRNVSPVITTSTSTSTGTDPEIAVLNAVVEIRNNEENDLRQHITQVSPMPDEC